MTTILRFSRGYDPISAVVSWATRSWASHVDFVLPSGQLLGAVPGSGVVIRESHPVAREEYWQAPVQEAWRHALPLLGRPYDWVGVFQLYCPGLDNYPGRNWRCPDSWFCSELVAYCLEQCGLHAVRAKVDRVTPADLLLSPLLHPLR